MYRKARIPKALREQVWLHFNGKRFENKCYVKWCTNKINVFNFQCGHNVPENPKDKRISKGLTILENLRPICCRCNLSMSNIYTIDEWNDLGPSGKIKKSCLKSCCFWF